MKKQKKYRCLACFHEYGRPKRFDLGKMKICPKCGYIHMGNLSEKPNKARQLCL